MSRDRADARSLQARPVASFLPFQHERSPAAPPGQWHPPPILHPMEPVSTAGAETPKPAWNGGSSSLLNNLPPVCVTPLARELHVSSREGALTSG